MDSANTLKSTASKQAQNRAKYRVTWTNEQGTHHCDYKTKAAAVRQVERSQSYGGNAVWGQL